EYIRKAFAAIQQLVDDENILAGHDVSAGGLITTILEMCFAHEHQGMKVNLDSLKEPDLVKVLFSENPGLVIQVTDGFATIGQLEKAGLRCALIGQPLAGDEVVVELNGVETCFDIPTLRDLWFKSSYLLERRQSGHEHSLKRYGNYHQQPLNFRFPEFFKGTFSSMGLDPYRTVPTGIKAAIIREKGVNGDREMAWMLHLAGFDVKDVHMTDLMGGTEDLSELKLIVFVGGFSNSDVLGSAKGWAGAFRYNDKARQALEAFYARPGTLSLGVCNGCQLMIELGLVTPGRKKMPGMLHNASGKFESAFLTVDILENHSVMLKSLAGSRLGIWVAHGEGKFSLPEPEDAYHIPAKYGYDEYPANPNGSDYSTAALCSADGRHLAIMPHLERAFYPWHWAWYPKDRRKDEVSPWMEAFVNAREWIKLQH
ncbi:MAG: phosphoribosylformylglycinamidine synthase, partial [Bacteroidetes bacterium HGW-Bacteroidetes-22]